MESISFFSSSVDFGSSICPEFVSACVYYSNLRKNPKVHSIILNLVTFLFRSYQVKKKKIKKEMNNVFLLLSEIEFVYVNNNYLFGIV